MLFNSITFAIFLPVAFLIYWLITKKDRNAQNVFLLIASYFFYGWWDWRFLILLIIVSVLNYFIGICIDRDELNRKRKIWLITGLIINIGILGVFKYFDFFVNSFIKLLSLVGYNLPSFSTKIILPLGISFYVFLSISYLIDIFKRRLNANRNIVEVLLSLGFFPIILAGPIQRPSSLLPQIAKKREFDYSQAVDGLRQFLWGLFAKVVIADNVSSYVDDIFVNYSKYSGSTLLLGSVFYSIQIYADFSGYSNMAIGIGNLFGFSLMQNFAYPYFSRNIKEFWTRWHISLTTWLRDYVFLPISFYISRKIKSENVLFIKSDLLIYIAASIITWFLTGLWHGANSTFIVWGLIHGFFLIIYQWQRKPRKMFLKYIGINNSYFIIVIIEFSITMLIVLIAWVFFRATSVHQAVFYIKKIFSISFFRLPEVRPIFIILLIIIFLLIEWIQRNKQHALQIGDVKHQIIRWGLYISLILMILYFGGSKQIFMYFQF
jgi:alginate O-acetyltransferase complex protein AlgI